MRGWDICMGGSFSGTSHTSKCFRTSVVFTVLTYTSAELRTCSSPVMSSSLLNTFREFSRRSSGIAPVTQTGSALHPVYFLYFGWSMQALITGSVPVQASMTRLPGFEKLLHDVFHLRSILLLRKHERLDGISLYLSCTHALPTEASVCWKTYLCIQGVSSSPLQARYSRRFQSLSRTMITSSRNKQLIPQRFYGLVSCSAGFIGKG